MAIRATYFALRDLSRDNLPGETTPDQALHLGAFVAEVIEIEKDRVGLATIDARVCCEVFEHTPDHFARTTSLRGPDVGHVPLFVPGIPISSVLTLAEKTDPLIGESSRRSQRELTELLSPAADAALSLT